MVGLAGQEKQWAVLSWLLFQCIFFKILVFCDAVLLVNPILKNFFCYDNMQINFVNLNEILSLEFVSVGYFSLSIAI